MCDRVQESKLDTRLKNFYLIYETYAMVRTKRWASGVQTVFRGYHASLFHELYYWFWTIWLFSLVLSVLTVHSVARKSSIICYSRSLNFSLQFRLWVRKKFIASKVSKISGKILSCNQRHRTQSKCIVAVTVVSNISTL